MLQDTINKNTFSFTLVKLDDGENFIDEIKKVSKEKKVFFFSANEFGKQRNLNRLYRELKIFFEYQEVDKTQKSIEEVFDYITKKTSRDNIILVLDNVEELFNEKDFIELEKLLKELKQTGTTLIFSTKNATFFNSFNESKLTKYMNTQQQINTKGFFCLEEDNNISAEDKFKYYAIFGDKKDYLKKIDLKKSLKTNIVDLFFNTEGFFFSEPNKILKRELRETQVYNLILEAISKGNTTLNEISEFVDMPTSICNKYTTVLLSLGVIEKIKPVFGKDTRKSRYKIKNSVMDFWYYFVPDNMSEIRYNNGEKVFEKNVEAGIHQYLQIKFPKLCEEYIDKLNKENKLKIEIKENGLWWNKNEKIDVVAGSGLDAIVADCYWRDFEVGIEEFNKLENKAKDLDVINREYFLFAKEGFSSELLDLAKTRDDIKLISFHDMAKGQEIIEKPKKKSFFFSRW